MRRLLVGLLVGLGVAAAVAQEGFPVGVGVGGIGGLGTGIATALGVNVGSAGAPVINGGVLGTPSSGTGTNITGIPNAGLLNSATTVAGQTCTLGSTCGLSTASNALSGDVSLSNTANFFDGPSMAQGTTGTWFASGSVTLVGGTGSVYICKLWDGTTVIAATVQTPVAVSGSASQVTLSGTLASPAANIKISCKDIVATTSKITFNNSSTNKDSTIYGVRIN